MAKYRCKRSFATAVRGYVEDEVYEASDFGGAAKDFLRGDLIEAIKSPAAPKKAGPPRKRKRKAAGASAPSADSDA